MHCHHYSSLLVVSDKMECAMDDKGAVQCARSSEIGLQSSDCYEEDIVLHPFHTTKSVRGRGSTGGMIQLRRMTIERVYC